MGLTAVCDSVTRYLQLRSFGNGSKLQNCMFQKVIRVYLNSLTDPKLWTDHNWWIERLRRVISNKRSLHSNSSGNLYY
jgi:hypothetical protein